MPAPNLADGGRTVTIRLDVLEQIITGLGLASNLAAANYFGVGEGTIWRLRSGNWQPSATTIAKLSLKLPEAGQHIGRTITPGDLFDFTGATRPTPAAKPAPRPRRAGRAA